jgi:hypothetical protein
MWKQLGVYILGHDLLQHRLRWLRHRMLFLAWCSDILWPFVRFRMNCPLHCLLDEVLQGVHQYSRLADEGMVNHSVDHIIEIVHGQHFCFWSTGFTLQHGHGELSLLNCGLRACHSEWLQIQVLEVLGQLLNLLLLFFGQVLHRGLQHVLGAYCSTTVLLCHGWCERIPPGMPEEWRQKFDVEPSHRWHMWHERSA